MLFVSASIVWGLLAWILPFRFTHRR